MRIRSVGECHRKSKVYYMPKPTNKAELLQAAENNFDKLFDYLDGLEKNQLNKDFETDGLNKNIRDVLMHLHHWHLLFMRWYDAGMKGNKPDMPEKGYTWQQLPELNRRINEKYKNTNVQKAMSTLKTSYANMVKLIKSHSQDELFEKKLYPWTGTTSLAAYLISNTSSHYGWAYRLIKKSLK